MSNYVPAPDILANVPANHNYQPGFTAAMMLKDLLLSQTCASSAAVHTPLAEHASMLYQHFIDSGKGGLDFSAIINAIK